MRVTDEPGEAPRTPASLVASLRDRIARLGSLTGREAVGSLVAGYAVVGRQAAQTAEGRRLADALRASPAGVNGEALWAALRIDRLAEVTPSPVLDHLRNDLALLLADGLEDAFREAERLPTGPRAAGQPSAEPFDSVDYLVGMWLVARELVAVVEAIVEPPAEDVRQPPALPDGPLLR